MSRSALSVTVGFVLAAVALVWLAWSGGRLADAAPAAHERQYLKLTSAKARWASPRSGLNALLAVGFAKRPTAVVAHAAIAPAPGAASTGEPTDLPELTPTTPPWAVELPLTTTTVSLFKGDQCAVWGETVGSLPTVTVSTGPVLVSYSMFSNYTQTPRYELNYQFIIRVGDTLADLTLNGRPLTTSYRGELRIEYVPAPVSKRYSYATYGLAQLSPGVYDLAGAWRLASGERDGPRRCRLVVTP